MNGSLTQTVKTKLDRIYFSRNIRNNYISKFVLFCREPKKLRNCLAMNRILYNRHDKVSVIRQPYRVYNHECMHINRIIVNNIGIKKRRYLYPLHIHPYGLVWHVCGKSYWHIALHVRINVFMGSLNSADSAYDKISFAWYSIWRINIGFLYVVGKSAIAVTVFRSLITKAQHHSHWLLLLSNYNKHTTLLISIIWHSTYVVLSYSEKPIPLSLIVSWTYWWIWYIDGGNGDGMTFIHQYKIYKMRSKYHENKELMCGSRDVVVKHLPDIWIGSALKKIVSVNVCCRGELNWILASRRHFYRKWFDPYTRC